MSVAPLSDAQATGSAAALFAAIKGKFGIVPNIFRVMGHAPDVLQNTVGLNDAVHHDLDPKLRELAYLTASKINKCGYCEHYHQPQAKKFGVSETQLQGLGLALDASLFSELERLVIRFSQEWTTQTKASPEVVAELSKHLTPTQLVTLAATVALANWTNKFNETFDVKLP